MTDDASTYAGRTKYDDARADRYQRKKPGKQREEMRLIDAALARIPKTCRVLDAPCGTGRVTIHLAQQGFDVTAADLSPSMIEATRETIARAGLNCPVESQDVEKLSYPDRHFGAIVCFRLFHHFPSPEIRSRVIGELCRVADRFVVLSYFAPSLSTLSRKLRDARRGKTWKKFATARAEVEGYFAPANFRLVKDFAQLPLVHTLHVALFERVESSPR